MEADTEDTVGTESELTIPESVEDSAVSSVHLGAEDGELKPEDETDTSDIITRQEDGCPPPNQEAQVEYVQSAEWQDGEIKELKIENEKLQGQKHALQTRIKDLEKENKKLFEVAEKNMDGPQRLESAKRRNEDELTELKASKISVDVKVEELRAKEISLIHREKMIEEEREELYGRISKLTSDLESTESKSLLTHSFHLQQLAQLQADVDNKTKQLKLEGDEKAVIATENQQLRAYCRDLTSKHKAYSDETTTSDLTLRECINNQNSIIELFQDKARDYDNKSRELEEAVSELQNLHKDALDNCAKLEQDFNLQNNQLEQEIEKRDFVIKSMAKEIEELRSTLNSLGKQDDTFEGLAIRSPSAAAAYRLKASDKIHGNKAAVTIQEYRKRIEALERENVVLNSKANAVMPNQESNKSFEAGRNIRESLETSERLVENLEGELQMQTTRKNTLMRENERLKIKNAYLGRQVSYLTREVEFARFGQKPTPETSFANDDLLTDAESVIAQKLVPFRNVEELQKRNIELLAIVRELADIRDTGTIDSDELIVMSNVEVQDLKLEVEELKNVRKRYEESLKYAEEELDSYRRTYENPGAQKFSPTLRLPSSTPLPRFAKEDKHSTSTAYQKLERRLLKAESDITFYKENLTREKEMGRERFTQIVSQLETARKETLEIKAELLRTQSLELHHKENTKLIKMNYQNRCSELAKLQENFSLIKDSNIKLEEANRFLKATIAEQKAIDEKQVSQIERLTENESILKKKILRLDADLQNLKTSSLRHKAVQENLKQIQVQMLRSDDEQMKNLQARNDSLVNELALMWKRLKQEEDRQKSTVAAWELANANLRNEVEEIKGENMSLSLSLDETNNSLQELRNRASSTNHSSSSGEHFEDQIRMLEAKNKSLNHLLSVEKETNSQLTELSKISEMRLIESNLDRRLLQERWDTERAKYLSDLQSLEARLALLINENQELNHKIRELESMPDLSETHLTQLAESQAEVTRLEVELKLFEDHKTSLEEQLKNVTQSFKEVEMRFEEESISHSETMSQLIEVQKNELKLRGETFEYKMKVKASEEKLKEAQNESSVAKAENGLIREHNLVLQSENEMLLRKHDELSELISSFTTNGAQTNVSVSGDESQTQLMEIVKQQRRERDILLERLETSEAELVRTKAELRSSKTDSSCYQDKIGREALPSSEYAKLLENVEAIPALKENNQVLRKENEALKQKVADIHLLLDEEKGHNEPLKIALKNSNERENSLNIELEIQKAESLRWRQRAHQLIEKDQRVDPEELKRLESENSELSMANKQLTAQLKQHSINLSLSEKKLCASISELGSFKKSKEIELIKVAQEISKAKAECRHLNEKLSVCQSKNLAVELSLKEAEAEKVRLSSEIEKLIVEKQTVFTLKSEIEDLRKTIQSKDDLLASKEVLVGKLRSSGKSLREKCETITSEKNLIEEKLKESQEGANALQDTLNKAKNDTTVIEQIARISELDNNMKSRDEELKVYRQNIGNLEIKLKELSKVADSYEKLKEDHSKLVHEIDNLKSLIASAVNSEKESVEKMSDLSKHKEQLETDLEILKSQHKKTVEDYEADKTRLLQTIRTLEQGSTEKGERPPQETVTASVKPVISATSQASQRKSTSVQPQAHIQPTRHAPSQTATMFVRSASIGRAQGQGEPNQPQVNVVGPIVSNYSLQSHSATETRETLQDELPRALVQPRQNTEEAVTGSLRPQDVSVSANATPQVSSQVQPSTSRGQVVLPTQKRIREERDVSEETDDPSKKARLATDSQAQEGSVTIELNEGSVSPPESVNLMASSHFDENVLEPDVEFQEDNAVLEENDDREQIDPPSEMVMIPVEEVPEQLHDLSVEQNFQGRVGNEEEFLSADDDLGQFETRQLDVNQPSGNNDIAQPQQDGGLENFGLDESLNEGSSEQVPETVESELAGPESGDSTAREQTPGSRASRMRITWTDED